MSLSNRLSVSAWMSVAAFVLMAAILALWPAQPLYAQATTPNVAVITSTVDLATTTASITVPVTLTVGGSSISSLTFALDYDASCLYIANPSSDVTGLPSGNGYTNQITNNPATGVLEISIWDADGTQTALASGNVAVIAFTLEAACRTNNSDRTIVFDFLSSPAVTFGGTDGNAVAGASYSGTYTLDINQLPTDVALTRNDTNATENVSGSRSVGTLAATDPDGTDTHTFALATTCTGTWDNQGFGVSSNNLTTDRTFNYEGTPSYIVCVQANDGQGAVFAETVPISVVNANDTPTAIALSSSLIVEGAAISTTIGTFSTTDEDVTDTFTYTLVAGTGSTDNAAFTIVTSTLVVSNPVDYDNQAIYKIRVRTTDTGNATYEQQFSLVVLGKSILSLRGEPDVPYVVAGSSVTVPVNFTAMGNDVVTATFAITYNDTCLIYAGAGGLTGLQSGFSSVTTDSSDDGTVAIDIASSSSVLREGVLGYLTFTGDAACDPGQWTDLVFSGTPALKAADGSAFNYATSNGKLVVVANDTRGDCNSDGTRNAGDFSATVREFWDVESSDTTAQDLAPDSWLWTSAGSYAGSAQGCDSNNDRKLAISDLICTARLFFGGACVTGVAAATFAEPVVLTAPASVIASAGIAAEAPIYLRTNGSQVSAAAFSVKIDATQLQLDPTDADQDGVPDAVSLHVPTGMLKMVLYDAVQGQIHIMLSGVALPMPLLADGKIASIQLTGSAQATGTPTPLMLTDVSLGDAEGNTVPAEVQLLSASGRLFLPLITQ